MVHHDLQMRLYSGRAFVLSQVSALRAAREDREEDEEDAPAGPSDAGPSDPGHPQPRRVLDDPRVRDRAPASRFPGKGV